MRTWIVQSLKHDDEETVRQATARMRRPMIKLSQELEPEVKTQNVVFYEGYPSYGGGPNFGPDVQAIIEGALAHARYVRIQTDPEYALYLELKRRYEDV